MTPWSAEDAGLTTYEPIPSEASKRSKFIKTSCPNTNKANISRVILVELDYCLSI
jgi:hypothetical protein